MSTRQPVRAALLRDGVSSLIGWALILKQAGIYFEPPAQISEVLVLAALVLIGVPGVANALSLRLGGGAQAPTASAPSSPPQAESPPR